MIRIGVRGIPETGWISGIDTFEVDALDPVWDSPSARKKLTRRLHPGQGFTLSFGHYFLRGKDRSDSRERARLAVERCSAIAAEASFLIVPPSFASEPMLNEILTTFRDEFAREKIAPPRIDLRFEVISGSPLPLERTGDPAWLRKTDELRTRAWRIHGDHPTRWIRAYSTGALDLLARSAFRHKPERIIFSHSQRFLQAEEFARRLESLNRKSKKGSGD
jgi:hypothetical protein